MTSSVNEATRSKQFALISAAGRGDVATVDRLLPHAALSVKNEALIRAAANGQVAVIELLHQSGARVRAEDDKALLLAIEIARCPRTVESLIRLGASVHARKEAPLRVALVHGHRKIADVLLAHGADVGAVGPTLRDWLRAQGDADIIALLQPPPTFERESDTAVRCTVSYPESKAVLTKIFDFRAREVISVAGGLVVAVQPFDTANYSILSEARKAYCAMFAPGRGKSIAPG